MRKKVSSFLIALIILVVGGWQWYDSSEVSTYDSSKITENQQAIEEIDLTDPPRFEQLVVSSIRSVDGDTFAFSIGEKEYKLRLLMVDTPESVKKDTPVQPYGKEASDFTKQQLANHQVSLVFDNGDIVDNYGRLLAYVYVDGDSLQELLLENGLGIVRYVNEGGDSYLDELLSAQAMAQENQLGVWKDESYVIQMKNGYYRYNEVQE